MLNNIVEDDNNSNNILWRECFDIEKIIERLLNPVLYRIKEILKLIKNDLLNIGDMEDIEEIEDLIDSEYLKCLSQVEKYLIKTSNVLDEFWKNKEENNQCLGEKIDKVIQQMLES